MYPAALSELPPTDPETGGLNVVIETPQGSRNKYKYDEKRGLFKLGKVLPMGMAFPFDFGFLPNTVGGDGDPLDVLVLSDSPAFPGCLVESRLLGVLEAEQTHEGRTNRNDRLLAVAAESHDYALARTLEDLPPDLPDRIEHFFVSYLAAEGKAVRFLGRGGPDRARQIIEGNIS